MRKSMQSFFLLIFLAACAHPVSPTSSVAQTIPFLVPTGTFESPASTFIPSPTDTQTTLPIASITPPSIQPMKLDPLALNEANAGAGMRRLGIFGTGEANDLAWSPDGNILAVASGRGVWLYDGMTLNETGFIDVNNSVTALAFHPNGKTLVVADKGAYVSVWNIQSGQMTGKFASGMLSIYKLAYGRDGKIAALGNSIVVDYVRDDIYIWDGLSGNQIFKDINESSSDALAFSPNGRLLVYQGQGMAQVLDMVTREVVASNSIQPNYAVFSPDGGKVFFESDQGEIGAWDISRDQISPLYDCLNRMVGGNGILICGANQSTAVIDMADEHVIRHFDFNLSSNEQTGLASHPLVLSSNGNLLAQIDELGNVNIIDTNDAKLVKSLPFTNFDEGMDGVATGIVNLDGKNKYLVATSNSSGQIQVWDAQTGQIIRTLQAGNPNTRLAFSPDHSALVSLSETGTLKLWDIQSAEMTIKLDLSKTGLPDGANIDRVLTSPDGIKLAIEDGSSEIYLVNLQSSQSLIDIGSSIQYGKAFYFTPEGHLLYFGLGSDDSGLTFPLFDGTTKATLVTLRWKDITAGDNVNAENSGTVEAAAISSNGKYLAYGTANGKIYVMSMETKQVISKLSGHVVQIYEIYMSSIRSVTFSPQSNLLVSTGYDGTTRLWNVKTGTELRQLNVCCYADFTPDGRYLVTAGAGVIRVWGIPAP
jgi:WD40 repeat protein